MNEIENSKQKMGRRTFFIKLGFSLAAFVGILVSAPVLGALLAPIFLRTPEKWRKVGNVEDFKINETVLVKFKSASPFPWSGITDETASWLRRVSDNEFVAFSVNCAHLGCPVRWVPDAELFLCPCHGSVYNKDGSYAAGPAPHGLSKYPVQIKNGKVEIKTSPIPITNI